MAIGRSIFNPGLSKGMVFISILLIGAGCQSSTTTPGGEAPNPTESGAAQVSSALPSEPILEGECPITPVQIDFWGYIGGAAGTFPVWMASSGKMEWSKLGPLVQAPSNSGTEFQEGHFTKMLLFVDKTVEGELAITGRQLDGNQRAYFPTSDMMIRISETTLQLNQLPPKTYWIEQAQNSTNFPEPNGKSHIGWGALFPTPGCYAFDFSINTFSVEVVVEIVDDAS
jgi:hypothetical protein